MFKPELTTESALERIGELKKEVSVLFDSEHEIIRSKYAVRDEIAAQLLRAGDLSLGTSAHFRSETEKGVDFLRARAQSVLQVYVGIGRIFGGDFSLDPFSNRLTDLTQELLTNAIEHGTQYCTRGTVGLWGNLGTRGAVIGIDQKPSQVQANTLRDRLQKEGGGFHHLRESKRTGGHGWWHAIGSKEIEVNFEDVQGGLRTLLFSALNDPDLLKHLPQ